MQRLGGSPGDSPTSMDSRFDSRFAPNERAGKRTSISYGRHGCSAKRTPTLALASLPGAGAFLWTPFAVELGPF